MTDSIGIGMVDAALVHQGVEFIAPALRAAMKSGFTDKGSCHIYVRVGGTRLYSAPLTIDAGRSYKEDYEEIAFRKARCSARTKADTKKLLEVEPAKLLLEDPRYPGGVYRRGISVGVSGFKDGLKDHLFAELIANAINVLAVIKTRDEVIAAEIGDTIGEILALTAKEE